MVKEGPGDINEVAALCIMMEGCDAAVATAAIAALSSVATSDKAAAAAGAVKELMFLFASQTGGPTSACSPPSTFSEPSLSLPSTVFSPSLSLPHHIRKQSPNLP